MSIQADLRNFLVSTPEVESLVSLGHIGKDTVMTEGYIFTDKPYKKVEVLNHQAILVLTSESPSSPPPPGSGYEFKRVNVDIWASPTRDSSGDVSEYDADDLIDKIYKAIKKYIHTTNSATAIKVWNGTTIVSSEITDGPDYRDVREGNGARMARIGLEVTI